jgi:hypothetical protein
MLSRFIYSRTWRPILREPRLQVVLLTEMELTGFQLLWVISGAPVISGKPFGLPIPRIAPLLRTWSILPKCEIS